MASGTWGNADVWKPINTHQAPGEESSGRPAWTRTVRPKEHRDSAGPGSPQPVPRAPAARADLSSPRRSPSKRVRLGYPQPEVERRKPRIEATPLPEPNMATKPRLPSRRAPSLPGVKMAAAGGAGERPARGAGSDLHAPCAQPSRRDADPGPSYWSPLVASSDWATWGRGGPSRPIAMRGLARGGAPAGAVK
ncbi:hypothetical protein J1605_020554 [Eschrichtius robustus]|uniref:Uncharacterized protein n=1 Tax=Eschrichtius robustus TaxID=9764 RepID=A0AB34HK22_ESCRO|nr:hypothetical protein J1605_020554 [Eschrichtius robustus]